LSEGLRTVLIVEDDPDVREVLAEVLGAYGYHVLTAADGQEGLDLLQGTPEIGAMVLDLMMPRVSGYELLEARSRDPKLGAVPVIVLTADRNAEARVQELGATLFLGKPPPLEALLAGLAACFETAAAG
jgi:CheY-like chemotaxis protein